MRGMSDVAAKAGARERSRWACGSGGAMAACIAGAVFGCAAAAGRADDPPAADAPPPAISGSDDGNDQSVDRRAREAAEPRRGVLLPADRDLAAAVRAWKSGLSARTGVDLVIESTTIFQVTTGSRGPNAAAVHTGGLSGTWTAWRSDHGTDRLGVGFAGEVRGNFSGDSFQDMVGDIGSLWSPNDATSGSHTKLRQLYFGHVLGEGRFFYLIGKIDPGAYLGANRFAGSGNTQFFSQPLAANPAKTFPENGLGAIARYSPASWFHVQGVVSDADAVDRHSPFGTLDGNWFIAGEAALKPVIGGLGEGRYRLMMFTREVDAGAARSGADNTAGWALSFDQNLGEDLGVFYRFGVNDGELGSLDRVMSGGVSFLSPFGRADDEAGIGVSWGRPSDAARREQRGVEGYYRVPLTDVTDLSASAQVIIGPSGGDEDAVGVFGVRVRVVF